MRRLQHFLPTRDYLQWKHVESIIKDDGEIITAKLRVYAGDIEEYYAFVTAEAYNALKEWIDFKNVIYVVKI